MWLWLLAKPGSKLLLTMLIYVIMYIEKFPLKLTLNSPQINTNKNRKPLQNLTESWDEAAKQYNVKETLRDN